MSEAPQDGTSNLSIAGAVESLLAENAPVEDTADPQEVVAETDEVEVEADASIIKARIKSSLASYRRPDKIMMRAQLPRNAANKISLRRLKSMAIEKDTGFVDF